MRKREFKNEKVVSATDERKERGESELGLEGQQVI